MDLGPDPAGIVDLQKLITDIIQISVGGAFIVLVVMLFIGGLKYLTSGGDPKAIASASQTLTWAVLGMLFLVLIWIALRAIESFTGIPVTKFCIGFPGVPTACP